MNRVPLSQIVWPIVVLTSVVVITVGIVLIFASAQAATLTALVGVLIVPTVTGLLALGRLDANHEETTAHITQATQTLADKVESGTS